MDMACKLMKNANVFVFSGGYTDSAMVGGYTQSPGGFASPALSQGGEKKGVSYYYYYVKEFNTTENTIEMTS